MVLKRNRGLSLDIGSRYERAEHKTHNSNRYVGLAGSGLEGGVEADPPDKNFLSPVWGSSSTSGGLNPATPPTNRTLISVLYDKIINLNAILDKSKKKFTAKNS